MIAAVGGGSDEEAQLHRDLAAHRRHGEWFSEHEDVKLAMFRAVLKDMFDRVVWTFTPEQRADAAVKLRATADDLEANSGEPRDPALAADLKSLAWRYGSAAAGSDEEATALADLRRTFQQLGPSGESS